MILIAFTVFKTIFFLIHGIQPLLIPLCLVSAWIVIILVIWSLWSTARESVETAQKMHQIPCSKCQFFTNNHRLKCTVRPSIANTEAAIGCSDYDPISQLTNF
jgi:ABC-type nickel/cobalt efflux system permease component RcnA